MRLAVVWTWYCLTCPASHAQTFLSKVNTICGHRWPNDELQWSVRVRPASARMTFSSTPTTRSSKHGLVVCFRCQSLASPRERGGGFGDPLGCLQGFSATLRPEHRNLSALHEQLHPESLGATKNWVRASQLRSFGLEAVRSVLVQFNSWPAALSNLAVSVTASRNH